MVASTSVRCCASDSLENIGDGNFFRCVASDHPYLRDRDDVLSTCGTVFLHLPIAEVLVETRYTGKKRGASLKHSIHYSLGTFKVLLLFLLAKLGFSISLFQSPTKSLVSRAKVLRGEIDHAHQTL